MGLYLGITKDIGIDLGTANIIVTIPKVGIVYREATAIAIDNRNGEVVATGNKAKEMIGKTPSYITAVRPLKEGVIADFSAAKLLLKEILKKIFYKYKIMGPTIVVGVPKLITEVERRAVEEVLYGTGARKVYIVEETIASAIGSGMRIEEAKGKMIVDIGGGTTEIAILSLGGIVTSESLRVAGDKFDNDIIKFIRRKYNVEIGEITAERIKCQIGTAKAFVPEEYMLVKGKDLSMGYPVQIEVNSSDMEFALRRSIYQITDEIKNVIEKTPPEVVSDIVETGIVITGGSSQIRYLDELIGDRIGVNVVVAVNPLDSVSIGTNMMVEKIDKYKFVYEGMRFNEQK